MMICTYSFRRRHNFVLLDIHSGNHILVPQGQNDSFTHNFTKNNCFQKINLVSDSDSQDSPLDPIKSDPTIKIA